MFRLDSKLLYQLRYHVSSSIYSHNIQGFKLSYFLTMPITLCSFMVGLRWFFQLANTFLLIIKCFIWIQIMHNLKGVRICYLPWKLIASLWNFIRVISTNKTRTKRLLGGDSWLILGQNDNTLVCELGCDYFHKQDLGYISESHGNDSMKY